jgi:peroxiredoxin
VTFGKVALALLLAGGISIGTTIVGERWIARWQGRASAIEGGAAELESLPPFVLPDLDGRATASASWAGKILVLSYWATWCPPCVRELPRLSAVQRSLGERGVQVVGIAVDRAEDLKSFLADRPVDYPVLIADPEAVELARRVGNRVQGLPFTVIFDGGGHRIFSHTGETSPDYLQAQLERLIGDAPVTRLKDDPIPPS